MGLGSKILSQKKQRGQSLVELGLTMMVILWLLSGAVDFGLGFFAYVAIRDAAQEGALFGSINPPLNTTARDAIIARVRQSSTTPVDLTDTSAGAGGVDVTVTAPASICAGNHLTVTVAYRYPVSTALVTTVTGPLITIRAASTSVILQPVCP